MSSNKTSILLIHTANICQIFAVCISKMLVLFELKDVQFIF